MKRLQDRVAVITGAGSGIGAATARRFADEGAKVVAVDMDPKSGQAIADEVGGIFVQADVTNADQVANMYKVAFDTYGSIDIAFNNAGISPPDDDSILTTGIDAWRRVQEVNLTSVYLCCKEVLPYMLEAKKGSIRRARASGWSWCSMWPALSMCAVCNWGTTFRRWWYSARV